MLKTLDPDRFDAISLLTNFLLRILLQTRFKQLREIGVEK